MPIYSFKCKTCGYKIDSYRTMADSNKECVCPACEIPMIRDFQNGRPHVTPKLYSRAIVSDALGIHPDQAAEHKAVYPNIPITPTGRLVFESYKEHDKYLTENEYQFKPRKRIRGKVTKVSEM